MSKRRKITRKDKVEANQPRIVAMGRISNGISETRITFESMSEIGQAAVRRVFKDTRRAEEIANA